MAMGKRERHDQGTFWVATSALPMSAAHPFYEQVNRILDRRGFDGFVEGLCGKFYHEETHEAVFGWVLRVLAEEDLLKGKTLGVDATTLEANAALKSIVRRDSGEGYQEFLTRLARESGIETPTREELIKLDKQRKNKASNDDWENPHEPDARITKMKDGRTHLAHKAEHAVDMDTAAIVTVTLQPADRGDPESIERTLPQAADTLVDILADEQAGPHLSAQVLAEAVADKAYHSNNVLTGVGQMVSRTYISEPARGRRDWSGDRAAQDAVYANRRRIRGRRGKRLMRKRGELIERSFAHCYDTVSWLAVQLESSDAFL